MNDTIVGIDLGTTNSEIAVPTQGRIEIIDIDESPMLPSVVGLDDNDELIVGAKARNQHAVYPERTVKSVKRLMGTDEKISLGEKTFTPQEISGMILKELKARAEAYLHEKVEKAVITVPAYFSDAQRQATRDAGEIAGLEVVRIINEPTAACLAFEHDNPDARKTVMAFDLGGGTFDVSIVRMDGDMVEVEGSHGDTHLGGDDIDEAVYEELLNRLHKTHENTAFDLDDVNRGRIMRAAETAKIRLSEADTANIIEDNLQTDKGSVVHLEEELTQSEFEQITERLLRKTITSVHKALAEADVNIGQIDEILLVGGSTRTPAVARLLEHELGQKPRSDIHPDLAVTYGAGVMAARLQGSEDHRILVDITPYTFGTSALSNLNGDFVPYCFVPLIHAGTPLPVTRSKTFYTAVPGQEVVDVTAFQGENEDARQNIPLGTFRVEGLDTNAPENSEIIIRMTLDLDGILHVQATEKATGLSKDIRIENSLGKMSNEALNDARRRVAELFGTSEDAIEANAEAAEPESVEAYKNVKQLISRAETQLNNMDETDRQDAVFVIARLRAAMNEEQTKEEMQSDIDELEDLLFYLDTSQ